MFRKTMKKRWKRRQIRMKSFRRMWNDEIQIFKHLCVNQLISENSGALFRVLDVPESHANEPINLKISKYHFLIVSHPPIRFHLNLTTFWSLVFNILTRKYFPWIFYSPFFVNEPIDTKFSGILFSMISRYLWFNFHGNWSSFRSIHEYNTGFFLVEGRGVLYPPL